MKRNGFLFITSRQAVLVAIIIAAGSALAAGTTYKVIYRFQGSPDGSSPTAPLIADQAGNLYGTTQNGGSNGNCFEGCGTVFRFNPPVKEGGAWQETILHNFDGSDGGSPTPSPLVFDQSGNLYGTVGNNVFQLTAPAKGVGEWAETVLYTFTGGNDGGHPNGVIFDNAGNLFGTTQNGGQYGQQGAGTVFKLTPPVKPGSAWSETTLYSFQLIKDGNHPGALLFDSQGNLYGINSGGDLSCTPKFPFGCGTVFELEAKSGSWVYQEIHAFKGFNDASYPDFSNLVFDQSGNLYGTTAGTGGTADINFQDPKGTVFKLTPPAVKGGSWTETFLHHFPRPGGIDGSFPIGGVVFDSSGNAYGVTFYGAGNTRALCDGRGCGIVFELKPPAVKGGFWKEIRLHDFTTGIDGGNPSRGVLLGPGGALFGITDSGGGSSACQNGCGTVFEVAP
jgi:hypothetical protein